MAPSAIQFLDVLEQRFREDAVEAPVQDLERMEWVGTCLSIAGVPLLIGEGELEEIIETPNVMAIPGTKPWVQGVGSHMGGLIPIISGDVFFSQTTLQRPRARLLHGIAPPWLLFRYYPERIRAGYEVFGGNS